MAQADPRVVPVSERQTGRQLMELAEALLTDEEYAECLSVVQLGLEKGAFTLSAAPILVRASLWANPPEAFKAVDIIRIKDVCLPFIRLINHVAIASSHCFMKDSAMETGPFFGDKVCGYPVLSGSQGPRQIDSAEAEDILDGKTGGESHYLSALVKLGQGAPPQMLALPVKLCLSATKGEHGGAWLLLASALSRQGQHTGAFSALEGGIEQAAEDWKTPLWHARARLETAEGDVQSALHCLQQAVSQASTPADTAPSWLLMGKLHLSRNSITEVHRCISQLDKLAQNARKGSAPHSDVLDAALALERGDYSKAFDFLERALEFNLNDPELLRMLGITHAAVDRSQHHQLLAYANLKRATAALPSDAEAWHILGLVCSNLGHAQEACECQAKALRSSRFPGVVDFVKMPLNIAPSTRERMSM